MANSDIKRPDLVEGWLEDIKHSWQKRKFCGIVPWWMLVFGCVGAAASTLATDTFTRSAELTIPFYAGILTVDGLFLAFSWSSFIKIYEAAGSPEFSAYLRKNGLLTKYFFHIDYIHVTQIIAVFVAFAALLTTVGQSQIPADVSRVILSVVVATLLYALKYALGAVKIMQDIVWYRTIYENSRNERGGGVVRWPDGNR